MVALKKPKIWIWVVSIFLILYYLSKLFALLGPPAIIQSITSIDSSFSISDYYGSMIFYLEEGSKHLNIDKTTLTMMSVYSGLISILFLIAVPFLFKCSSWARQFIIVIIGVEVLVMIAGAVYFETFPSMDILIIYVIISIFLLWPSVAMKFSESHNQRLYSDAR
jgi:hypothetical protein